MMNQEVTIGPLRGEEDARWCARLMADSEPWLTIGRSYQAALEIFNDADNERYVATADGERAGFIVVVMKGSFIGYIKSLAIAPAYRNRGLGRRLIEFAEERIFIEQPNVFLCVSTFNPNAKRLYERLGYKVIGLLDDYIVPGHGEYLMRKSIAPMSEFVTLSASAAEQQNNDGRGKQFFLPRVPVSD